MEGVEWLLFLKLRPVGKGGGGGGGGGAGSCVPFTANTHSSWRTGALCYKGI